MNTANEEPILEPNERHWQKEKYRFLGLLFRVHDVVAVVILRFRLEKYCPQQKHINYNNIAIKINTAADKRNYCGFWSIELESNGKKVDAETTCMEVENTYYGCLQWSTLYHISI